MNLKFLYMKFLGLLLVLVGFSYSLTSFNNFFSFVFKTKIFAENLNIYVMSIGLVVPLFIFIFGVYFYFYTDFNIEKINKFIFISFILILLIALMMICFNELYIINNFIVFQIYQFIHISCAYVLIFLAIMGIYGCIKYKY